MGILRSVKGERFSKYQIKDIIVCDSKGIIETSREDIIMNKHKNEIALTTNKNALKGKLQDALTDADVFIGVSLGNLLSVEMVQTMAEDPIIFALANPTPEIFPEDAKKGGASVVATGRSDYPNQVNNVLVFPVYSIFLGAEKKYSIFFINGSFPTFCLENSDSGKIKIR